MRALPLPRGYAAKKNGSAAKRTRPPFSTAQLSWKDRASVDHIERMYWELPSA